MIRPAQLRRIAANDYGPIPLVTAKVADLTDATQFPEIALAREHARKLRERGQ